MAEQVIASTQTAYPWRATLRTAFAFLVGLAAAWALIIEAAGIDSNGPPAPLPLRPASPA
jgi:hypothetical protein